MQAPVRDRNHSVREIASVLLPLSRVPSGHESTGNPTLAPPSSAERSGEAGARGIQWDLSDLYAGPADPRLASDADEALRRADHLAGSARGRIRTGAASAAETRDFLLEYEAVLELAHRPAFYAGLLAAADSQDPVALALEQRTNEQDTEVRARLLFLELEIAALDETQFLKLVADPALAAYAHFMRTVRCFKPHVLSEPEERVLTRKDLSGRAAFVQLYDELCGSLTFQVPGHADALAEGEVLALLHHPDRESRQRALDALLDTYASVQLPLTAIMNALLLDHRLECDMRGYRDAIVPTHLANEIEPAVVDAMMGSVERHYPVIRRFLAIKARLLALPQLGICDLFGPVGGAAEAVPYSRARDLVLEAFQRFDPDFSTDARAFFDGAWIDAETRTGKRAGAFCAALDPHHHPYLLTSYADTSRDATTLAHELGHGVHYLRARRQTYLSYEPPLVLAETASVFAEMLVTHHLLTLAPDAATRRRILVETLDEIYGTVFRQHALTRFELAAHAARQRHRLSTDDLCNLWIAEQTRLFGSAVSIDPGYRFGWTYIPHFVHSRFYCYAYAFGEILTLTLFQQYTQRGPEFLPRYRELLASGGSEDPIAATARLGLDLRAPAFWDAGCSLITAMVDELEASC